MKEKPIVKAASSPDDIISLINCARPCYAVCECMSVRVHVCEGLLLAPLDIRGLLHSLQKTYCVYLPLDSSHMF